MKRITIRRLALAFYFSVIFIVMQGMTIDAFAEEDLAVSIGGSTWNTKAAYSQDVSRHALEDGQRAFTVSASADESFPIRLSEKQAEDILAGSTVVVNTEDGNRKVKIEPKKKKAVKSGW